MPFQACLFFEILERCDLIERLHADGLDLDLTKLSTYLMHVEAHYGANAYHNRKHGADVLLGVYRFLAERTQPHSASLSDSGAVSLSGAQSACNQHALRDSGAQPPAGRNQPDTTDEDTTPPSLIDSIRLDRMKMAQLHARKSTGEGDSAIHGAISGEGDSAISPPRDGSSDGAHDGARAPSRAPLDWTSGWALSPLQTFAGLFAAAVHDFNHPGTNNSHEVKCDSARALQYALP